jgi:hypothetical protein
MMAEREHIERVRLRRMAECWRESAPSDEIVALAPRRFERRRAAPRRAARMLVVALAQGFVLGIVTLAAASWMVTKVLPALRAHEPLVIRAVEQPKTRPSGHGSRGAAPMQAEAEPPTATFEEVGAPVGSALPHTTQAAEPRVAVPVVQAAPSDVGPSAASGPAPGTARASLPPVAVPEIPSAVGPWSRVAEALAAGDYGEADRALASLGGDRDATTRDAAELARAELWIARGAGAGFRPSLERLAASGQTPLIRRRAAALIERLDGAPR